MITHWFLLLNFRNNILNLHDTECGNQTNKTYLPTKNQRSYRIGKLVNSFFFKSTSFWSKRKNDVNLAIKYCLLLFHMSTTKKNKLTNISVNVLVIPAKFPDASGHKAMVRVPCRMVNKNTRYFISPSLLVRKSFSDVSGLIRSLYIPYRCCVQFYG